MHAQAAAWLEQMVKKFDLASASVLDLGGREVYHTHIHGLFDNPVTVLDIRPDEGVDIVADAATWTPTDQWDVVLCTEVFEHTPAWPDIIRTAHQALRPGGTALFTCARDDRPPHSAIDGGDLRPGEYYANLTDKALTEVLQSGDWTSFSVYPSDGYFGDDDLYARATR